MTILTLLAGLLLAASGSAPRSHLQEAKEHLDQGRLAEAEASLEKALAADRRDERVWELAALIQLRRGDGKAAFSNADRALDLAEGKAREAAAGELKSRRRALARLYSLAADAQAMKHAEVLKPFFLPGGKALTPEAAEAFDSKIFYAKNLVHQFAHVRNYHRRAESYGEYEPRAADPEIAALVRSVASLPEKFDKDADISWASIQRLYVQALRLGLDQYVKDHGGKRPEELEALMGPPAGDKAYLDRPTFSVFYFHEVHPRNKDVERYDGSACDGDKVKSDALKDTGRWGYVYDESAPCHGRVFLDCTHESPMKDRGRDRKMLWCEL